jgi:hypothetical protein
MSEIKPCPFCGSEAKVYERNPLPTRVYCSNCQCAIHAISFLPDEWNRRAVDPEELSQKKSVTRITEILATGECDKLKVTRISEVLKKMQIEIDAIVRGKGQHENDNQH